MKYNLSSNCQRTNLAITSRWINRSAATRHIMWRSLEEFSCDRNIIIWRSLYNSCGGRQLSHMVAARSISFVSPTGFRTDMASLTKIQTLLKFKLSIVNNLPSTSKKINMALCLLNSGKKKEQLWQVSIPSCCVSILHVPILLQIKKGLILYRYYETFSGGGPKDFNSQLF